MIFKILMFSMLVMEHPFKYHKIFYFVKVIKDRYLFENDAWFFLNILYKYFLRYYQAQCHLEYFC